jgi:hypothetical protein
MQTARTCPFTSEPVKANQAAINRPFRRRPMVKDGSTAHRQAGASHAAPLHGQLRLGDVEAELGRAHAW